MWAANDDISIKVDQCLAIRGRQDTQRVDAGERSCVYAVVGLTPPGTRQVPGPDGELSHNQMVTIVNRRPPLLPPSDAPP